MLATLLAALFLYFVSTEQGVYSVFDGMYVHEFVHDGRHLLGFALLNAWGGVAIGEHLGQLLTASFALQLALLQRAEGARVTAALGGLAAALIIIGAGEGIAIAFGGAGEGFALCTVAGFMVLTAWLLATGVGLLRPAPAARLAVA